MFPAFRKTISEKMERKDVFKCILKRSEKVKTLSTKTFVNFTGKDDTIDLYLLLQRLVIWQRFPISALKVVKDMKCVYILQLCLN